jgi:hypothetical protein
MIGTVLYWKPHDKERNWLPWKNYRDALILEAENIRYQRKKAAELKVECYHLLLEAKRQAANIEAMEKKCDALNLEAQYL